MGRYAVFGATGATGRLVVKGLLASGDEVVAVGRNTRRLRELKALGAATVALDLMVATVQQLTAVLEGCDGVVFLAGSTDPSKVLAVDRDGSIRTVAAAELAGADRFVQVSSIGAGDRIPPEIDTAQFAPYYVAKRAADEHLRASSLQWTIIEPGWLVDQPPAGAITLGPTRVPMGEISRADVADVLVHVVHDGRSVGHQWQLVGGSTPIARAVAALT
jgi:uncharacterized protein YbjT (DUF2867 family)